MDKCLEDATEAGEDDALSSDAVTAEAGDATSLSSDAMREELSRSLELTKCELSACKDCCDEAEYQLSKLNGLPSKQTRMLLH